MTKTNTYFDLRSACGLPGCPICRVEQTAVKHALDALLYEQVNDSVVRDHLRASLGFCHEHAWLVIEELQGNALGLAIIYNDVLAEALRQLDQPPRRHGRSPSSHRTCPACEQRRSATHRALSVLAEYINDPELNAALKDSEGLCLPHLRLALDQFKEPDGREFLLTIHREKFNRLRAELAEFIRKNDYRFMHEGSGSERDSWRRAVAIIAGNKLKI